MAESSQLKAQKAVDKDGTMVHNILEGVSLESPLHSTISDVPVDSWIAALVFAKLEFVSGSGGHSERRRHIARV